MVISWHACYRSTCSYMTCFLILFFKFNGNYLTCNYPNYLYLPDWWYHTGKPGSSSKHSRIQVPLIDCWLPEALEYLHQYESCSFHQKMSMQYNSLSFCRLSCTFSDTFDLFRIHWVEQHHKRVENPNLNINKKIK